MDHLLFSPAAAYLACLGLCFILQIKGKPFFLAPLGGTLLWASYQFLLPGCGELLACFLSTVLIAVYTEIMARICRCPATGFLQVGLLPLVPGGGIYHAMKYCLAGETMLFLRTAIHTFGIAGSLALGVVFVSGGLRIYQSFLQKKELFPHE